MVIIGYSTVPEMKVQLKSLYLLGYFTKKCYYKPKESIKQKQKRMKRQEAQNPENKARECKGKVKIILWSGHC